MKIMIVLDTNWYISGTINRNSRRQLYQLITNQQLEIFYSKELLLEYKDVITRKKFRKHITWKQAKRFISTILPLLHEVAIISEIDQSRDKNDNYLLSMSVDAKVDYLVTGDPHLLELKRIEKTRIINMREFKHKLSKI